MSEAYFNKTYSDFEKKLSDIDYSKGNFEKFKDFCSILAFSLANSIYRNQELQKLYLNYASSYTPEQLNKMTLIFSEILVPFYTYSRKDFLGRAYMRLGISNKNSGQFFTPISVSTMMARICENNQDLKLYSRENPCLILEPCSGSGSTIIDFYYEILNTHGIRNFPEIFHTKTVDLDLTCFCMSYIQFFLLDIPATVIHGDSLTEEVKLSLNTLAHFRENWDYRLREKSKLTKQFKGYKIFFEGINNEKKITENIERINTVWGL